MRMAKIAAVLPDDLKTGLDATNLLIGPGKPIAAGDAELPAIRAAIRTERKLQHRYRRRPEDTDPAHHLAVRDWHSSTASAWSSRGANCATAIGTFAPIGSRR